MKLYTNPYSTNSHKVRLLLSFLNIPHQDIVVDFSELKSADFLKVNPLGQIPVLVDGDVLIRDSQAILIYLARKYNSEQWLPLDAASCGRITQWLSFAANDMHQGLYMTQLHCLLNVPIDVAQAQQKAGQALAELDRHLQDRNRDWLECDRPTIADLACFPEAALAHNGQISLDPYPNVVKWLNRLKALPNFTLMPGL